MRLAFRSSNEVSLNGLLSGLLSVFEIVRHDLVHVGGNGCLHERAVTLIVTVLLEGGLVGELWQMGRTRPKSALSVIVLFLLELTGVETVIPSLCSLRIDWRTP